MARSEVFRFLKALAQQPEQVLRLRTLSKPEVLASAWRSGYAFSEAEFDEAVWGIEQHLAGLLGEPFDLSFSLWETMWGKYYLEFLVDNSVGAVTPHDIEAFLGARPQGKENSR
ncbi:hypothetical protein [Corallococcus sicarius]|uniref:Nif11 family protein n=1 Tax=Corallococcus sicarius TaxID=2316726 RepID=A0A3A8NPN2_9BACT|nr:hypothetical protein [Corallococcus sicarius]RKH41374.1 hypothetical protein D7X12_18375 [Corallococcus sicarius]